MCVCIYIYYVYIYIRMHMSGDFAISCGAVCFGLRLEGVQLSYRLPLYRHRKRRAPCGYRAGSRAHGLTGFSRATGQHGLTGSRHVTRKDHSRWQTGSSLFRLTEDFQPDPFLLHMPVWVLWLSTQHAIAVPLSHKTVTHRSHCNSKEQQLRAVRANVGTVPPAAGPCRQLPESAWQRAIAGKA